MTDDDRKKISALNYDKKVLFLEALLLDDRQTKDLLRMLFLEIAYEENKKNR